ncbi:hypothetical protein FQZ97_820360 [compost metagenome]
MLRALLAALAVPGSCLPGRSIAGQATQCPAFLAGAIHALAGQRPLGGLGGSARCRRRRDADLAPGQGRVAARRRTVVVAVGGLARHAGVRPGLERFAPAAAVTRQWPVGTPGGAADGPPGNPLPAGRGSAGRGGAGASRPQAPAQRNAPACLRPRPIAAAVRRRPAACPGKPARPGRSARGWLAIALDATDE